ncbi:MAG: YlxM family DNA-binding protein [Clostridia bacterium]|nr:YlxM family DNA-binding protein [Clostridia bacterium]
MEKNVEISLLLSFYKNMLTERQADTAELYYNEDLSLSEIGTELGISRQGVRDNLKRAESTLYDVEEKLGLAKRFLGIKSSLREIDAIISQIEKSPESRLLPNSIKHQINDILTIVAGINEIEI